MVERASKIGLITAIIISLNAMIGSGIFSAPAALSTQAGPAGILAFIFVTAAVWCLAQSFGRLSQLFPQEGSFYLYTKQWGGHYIGILASTFYLIGVIIAMGLLCQIAGSYIHTALPYLSACSWGVSLLISLVLLNMFGVALSQAGQYVLIGCTVFPLIATIVICLMHINMDEIPAFAVEDWTQVLRATRIIIFGFFGFECATSLYAIVENPEKNVPRALTYSILIIGLLYTIFVASIMYAVPSHFFTHMIIPLPEILSHVLKYGRFILPFIHFSILSAIIGTIHSMIWSSSVFFADLIKLMHTNKKNEYALNQKFTLLFIGSGILSSFILLKNIDLFFSLTAMFIVCAFLLSIITLLTRKSEWKSGFNIITLLAIFTAGMIFTFALQNVLVAW